MPPPFRHLNVRQLALSSRAALATSPAHRYRSMIVTAILQKLFLTLMIMDRKLQYFPMQMNASLDRRSPNSSCGSMSSIDDSGAIPLKESGSVSNVFFHENKGRMKDRVNGILTSQVIRQAHVYRERLLGDAEHEVSSCEEDNHGIRPQQAPDRHESASRESRNCMFRFSFGPASSADLSRQGGNAEFERQHTFQPDPGALLSGRRESRKLQDMQQIQQYRMDEIADEISVDAIAYRFADEESISDEERSSHLSPAMRQLSDQHIQALTQVQRLFRAGRLKRQAQAKNGCVTVSCKSMPGKISSQSVYKAYRLTTTRKIHAGETVCDTVLHLEAIYRAGKGPHQAKAPKIKIVEVIRRYGMHESRGGACKTIQPTQDGAKEIVFAMKGIDAERAEAAQRIGERHGKMLKENSLLACELKIFEAALNHDERLSCARKIRGPDLNQIIGAMMQGNPIAPRIPVLKSLAALLQQVKAMHDDGLIHGDIKPANIMIDPGTGKPGVQSMHNGPRAYLIDFDHIADEQSASLKNTPGTAEYIEANFLLEWVRASESRNTSKSHLLQLRKVNDQVAFLKTMLEASARSSHETEQIKDCFEVKRVVDLPFFQINKEQVGYGDDSILTFHLRRFIQEKHIGHACLLLSNPSQFMKAMSEQPKLHLAAMVKADIVET